MGSETSTPGGLLAGRAVAAATAAAVLYGVARAFPAVPCWGLVLVAALLAWPMWCAYEGYAALQRRVLLAGLTVEESRMRRLLWAGRVRRVAGVFTAFVWAFVLAAFAARFDRWQWAVVGVDAIVLAIAIEPARRLLSGEVRAEHRALLAGRWPLMLFNVALLSAAFFVLDFAVVGAPDTRGLAWLEVYDRAWAEASAAVACPFAAGLLGALAAAERLAWHAAEVMIPALPQPGWRLAAWAFFLLQAGLAAYALTRLLIGAAVLVEREAWRAPDASARAPVFWITAAAIVTAWVLAIVGLAGADLSRVAQQGRVVAAKLNPCKPDAEALQALASRWGAELDAARLAAHAHADAQIDASLPPIFAEAALGVDRYLDWYFTVLGEYQRLAALSAGELEAMMARELEKHLFGDGMLGERLERASVAIGREAEARMGEAARRLGVQARESLAAQPCELGSLDFAPLASVQRDVVRASAAAGSGAIVGVVAVRALGAAVAGRAASRAASKSTLRTARGLLGRAATKRGGTWLLSIAGAAALCAPGGPLAFVCGAAAAIVGWLAMDKAFIGIDEFLFRDAMRAEILGSVTEQQAELTAALRAEHHARIDAMAAVAAASIERAFVPARHGL